MTVSWKEPSFYTFSVSVAAAGSANKKNGQKSIEKSDLDQSFASGFNQLEYIAEISGQPKFGQFSS